MTARIPLSVPSADGPAGGVWLSDAAGLPQATGPRLLIMGDFYPGADTPQMDAWLSVDAGGDAPLLPALTSAADYSLVNLECPLGAGSTPRKVGPRLSADPAWAKVLAAVGIDAVSLANNHAMDHGEAGLAETIDAVAAAGLAHVGAGQDLGAANRPLVVRIGARSVAILAWTENEFGIAGRSAPGVAPLHPESALRRVREARDAHDAAIVILHAGNELFRLPRPGLRDTCRFLVDCGASAVVCCHSHVTGTVERYRGAPIVYGLGNLYFPWPTSAHCEGTRDSLCVLLDLGQETLLHLVPARFEETRQGIRGTDAGDLSDLARRLEGLSATLADDDALDQAFRAFVHENRRSYLTGLLALTRAERSALRAGIWPFWRMPRRRLPELLNLVRCESHREAVLCLLEQETRRD